MKTIVISLVVLGVIASSSVTAGPQHSVNESMKRPPVRDFTGKFGIDWNHGLEKPVCQKVEKNTVLYKQLQKAKCKPLQGAKALTSFKGTYFDCRIEKDGFQWMIYPSAPVCADQVTALGLPSP